MGGNTNLLLTLSSLVFRWVWSLRGGGHNMSCSLGQVFSSSTKSHSKIREFFHSSERMDNSHFECFCSDLEQILIWPTMKELNLHHCNTTIVIKRPIVGMKNNQLSDCTHGSRNCNALVPIQPLQHRALNNGFAGRCRQWKNHYHHHYCYRYDKCINQINKNIFSCNRNSKSVNNDP